MSPMFVGITTRQERFDTYHASSEEWWTYKSIAERIKIINDILTQCPHRELYG
jgi:hypothetical protein